MGKRGWIVLIVLVAAVLAAHLSGVADMASLESVQARRNELLALVEAHPVVAPVAFVAAYVLIVSLSLPVAVVATLLGGFLFGPVLGTVLVVVAGTAGATVVFLVARTAVGEGLRRKAGPLYERVATGMRDNAFEYLLFLRIVPLFPFFLVNILPALFDVRLRTFVLATLVGIVPGTFVYANLGRELGTISSLGDLFSMKMFLAFLLLGIVALIPAGYRAWKRRRSVQPPAAVVLVALGVAATFADPAARVAGPGRTLERIVEPAGAATEVRPTPETLAGAAQPAPAA
jgi:uncharacterized membrane protein YdjX (TVP38/TMEM64 family)